MLRKAFGAFVVAFVALVPTVAQAQFHAGEWELTLGGNGTSNKGLTTANFNVAGSLGYFFTKNLEVSFRQSVGYNDQNAGTSVLAQSRVAADWHFDLGKWQPFIGVNGGYSYGSHGVHDTWEVAPEGGVKFFLNSTTFVFGLAEYQILLAHGGSFSSGAFVYSLGLGVALK